ncbi:hypothetical protein [Oceanobacillus luteolus]|uniref:Uncharacterized protein n=1 Tax=Oceanobacillus luteolus TaxID=1274358 RepID=A0ABW4HVU3_9BACI
MIEEKYKLNQFAQEIEQEMRRESFSNHYYYENEYLIKHNLTCPLCKGKIKKNFKNVLTGAHVIGMIQLQEQRTSISYSLCKKCSKNLQDASTQEKETYESIIRSHVVAAIGIKN